MTPLPPGPRTSMRRVVVVVPSAFTLGNLFFGFWAVVSAYNGNFLWAGWFIVFAGILDGLDGRVARMSNTGSRFGAELDSLVDVISFGVAPAMIMYFLEFNSSGRFAWVICFLYVVCTAIRLARYNVTSGHGGRPSSWFTGLPSPAAGTVLAVYFPFSQTTWYQSSLAYLNVQMGIVILMVVLAVLMVSNVKYPRFQPPGFRTPSQTAGSIIFYLVVVAGLVAPARTLFPIGLLYVAFGLIRALALNLTERSDDRDQEEQRPMSLVSPSTRARRSERRRETAE
jgi:CDP-diacylglycerol--serine O-phosphatidyltransferase